MSKRILLWVVLLAANWVAVAQPHPTLRVRIYADTYDESIGPGVDISKTRFGDFMLEVAGAIGYDEDIQFRTGDECRKATLMKDLEAFKCDTSDIIVFCYMGHGGRSLDDTSLFPQMCLHERYSNDFVPVEKVKNMLAKHGARLTWVIGDCCNSYSEFIRPKDVSAAGDTRLPGATVSLIEQLFKNTTGVVTMCASKPGTYGWSNNGLGMYFNNELIRTIKRADLNSIIPGQPWQSVMSIVQKNLYVHDFVDKKDPLGTVHKMEPRYRIEPRRHVVKPRVEVKENPTLQSDLSKLASNSRHSIERMRMVPDIKQKHFATDAIVRTVNRDGTISIGAPRSVDEYLTRLTQSNSILNVIVRKSMTNEAGKVTYLEVHEIHKEIN